MTNVEFKQLRKDLSLTQTEYGKLFGFGAPQVRVAEIEAGKVKVSEQVEMLCRYIRHFGILPELQKQTQE